jgi:hypothetical protein
VPEGGEAGARLGKQADKIEGPPDGIPPHPFRRGHRSDAL